MLSPTVQEYSDQRFDHSQHVKRKAVLMAIGDQSLCSLNARGRTTTERSHVTSTRTNRASGPYWSKPAELTDQPALRLQDAWLARPPFGMLCPFCGEWLSGRLPFFEIRPSPPARRRSRGRNNKEERRPRHAKRNRGAKADPRAASGRVKLPPDGPGKREVSSTGTAALPNPHLRGRSPVNLGSNVGYYLAQPHQCGIHVKRCRPLKGLPKCGDADRSAQQLQRKVSRKDRS